MKMFIKAVSFILCIIMLIVPLASCANDNDNDTIIDPSQNTENVANAPTFVDADFDGEKFTILSAVIDVPDFSDNYIDNEEITGEPINDAVIERNRAVEEKYNVDIEVQKHDNTYATQASKSGTVDFEVVYDWGIRLVRGVTEGIYYDFLQLPNIDFTQDYWVPSAQEDLTIADKLLITPCDISMNRLGYASFIIFNKRLLDDYGIEYPYDLVNQNQWTVDNFYETILECGGTDVNGDTLWDAEDIYAWSGSGLVRMAVNGAGLPTTYALKNDDGTYTLNVYTEKLVTIYNNYSQLNTPEGVMNCPGWETFIEGRDISMYDSVYQAGRVFCFGEGHAAFSGTSMAYLKEFAAMEDQYGLVPNPKYELSQSEYYHYIDNCAPMFSVIKQCDLELTGTILEYMCYESEQKLLPAFYDQTVKTKQTSDIEGRDEKMLDIIRDSIHFSWTSLYYLGIPTKDGSVWNPCSTMENEMLSAGNFASVNKRFKEAAQYSLDAFYDMILNMDVNK